MRCEHGGREQRKCLDEILQSPLVGPLLQSTQARPRPVNSPSRHSSVEGLPCEANTICTSPRTTLSASILSSSVIGVLMVTKSDGHHSIAKWGFPLLQVGKAPRPFAPSPGVDRSRRMGRASSTAVAQGIPTDHRQGVHEHLPRRLLGGSGLQLVGLERSALLICAVQRPMPKAIVTMPARNRDVIAGT